MSYYNINAGYGQIVGQWPFTGGGKVFCVGATAVADRNFEIMSQLMKVDPDGKARLFTTIDAAIGACTNDANDHIYVLPGHVEYLSSASAIACDVSGVSIIGLGHGDIRPQILLDTAATTSVWVSADDVLIDNLIFKSDYADVAACIEVDAAENCTVKNCDFLDNEDEKNFLIAIRIGEDGSASASNGMTIENCRFITPDTSSTYFVHIKQNIERLTIKDNYINMGVNTNDYAPIFFATGMTVNDFVCEGNRVIRLNDNAAKDLFIDNDQSDNTGIIANNYMLHNALVTEPLLIDCDGCGLFENYESGNVTTSGRLMPVVNTETT